jgi:hypothetical protein
LPLSLTRLILLGSNSHKALIKLFVPVTVGKFMIARTAIVKYSERIR